VGLSWKRLDNMGALVRLLREVFFVWDMNIRSRVRLKLGGSISLELIEKSVLGLLRNLGSLTDLPA
jgi:hypothetical protein